MLHLLPDQFALAARALLDMRPLEQQPAPHSAAGAVVSIAPARHPSLEQDALDVALEPAYLALELELLFGRCGLYLFAPRLFARRLFVCSQ